jgi:pimeloyl-ACP methyl ester carboxylesterase
VLWGEEDVYAEARFADRAAELAGARVVRFPSCGHWWQCQEPEKSALVIERFWHEVEAREP